MKVTVIDRSESATPNLEAQRRLHADALEPLFIASWHQVLMMHLEVNPCEAQACVPFPLDLYHGRAFVSLVCFKLRDLRPRFGGHLTALLFKPISTHDFLNVRTYVSVNGEPGIHFLAEWLSNRIAVQLGPPTFALPYKHGRIRYRHARRNGFMDGIVEDMASHGTLRYTGQLAAAPEYTDCETGSLDEWLMERYTAFNRVGNRERLFRVWHQPWPQSPVEVVIDDASLLVQNWLWLRDAELIGSNFSPGVDNVWMGRPRRLNPSRYAVAIQPTSSSPNRL